MAMTPECNRNAHGLCGGRGRSDDKRPQFTLPDTVPPFYCSCPCHHRNEHGVIIGKPCRSCYPEYDHNGNPVVANLRKETQ